MLKDFWYFLRIVWSVSPRWFVTRIFYTLNDQLNPILQLLVGQRIIDRIVTAATTNQSFDAAWPPILILIIIETILFVANAFLGRMEQLQDHVFRVKFDDDISLRILAKNRELDLAQYDDPEFHNRVSKLTGEAGWRMQMIYQNSFGAFGSILTIVASATLFLQLPIWILIILFLALLPTFKIHTDYGRQRTQIEDDHRKDDRLANYYAWLLTHRFMIKDIKLLQIETYFGGQIARIWSTKQQAIANNVRTFLPKDLGATFLSVVARTFVTIWLVSSTLLGRLTIGQLTLYTNLMSQFAGGLRGLLMSLANMTEHLSIVDHYRQFMAATPLIPEPMPPTRFPRQPITIAFNNVWFRYTSKTPWILRGVSFTIRPGEHVALVGNNGAGKTTIVKLLARFYDPERGSITLGGIDLRNLRRADIYRYLAVMFQDYAQFEALIKENIGFGDATQRDGMTNIITASRQTGAHSFIQKLPEQYESMLSRQFKEGIDLSGGEWQKIALARTFFRKAGLYIMDEPTAALDASAEEHFYRQFLKLEKHVSAILISHRFSTVRMADNILVLDKGKIIEQGSHEELIVKNGRYANLFMLQAKRYK